MTRSQDGANAAPPTLDETPDSAPVLSWSQYDLWRRCPNSHRLKRAHAPRRPGVWLPAGTAFHAAVETYLRGTLEGA